MFTIYVYVLDTMVYWELGHVTAELHSRRFFKKDAPQVVVKTVSDSKEPIRTMGGLTVVPDCLIDDMVVSETSVLLLPRANTWSEPKHGAILEKAREFLDLSTTVGAICGATAATMLVTQFVKGLADKFFNVPTNLIAYGVALVVLILAQQFTGTLDESTVALSAFNAILVATAASGSYDAANRMKDGFIWKKEDA